MKTSLLLSILLVLSLAGTGGATYYALTLDAQHKALQLEHAKEQAEKTRLTSELNNEQMSHKEARAAADEADKAAKGCAARLAAIEGKRADAEQRLEPFRKTTEEAVGSATKATVFLTEGRLTVRLPSDALFEEKRPAELRALGQALLVKLGKALAALPGERFDVVAHTDAPPAEEGTPSGGGRWELSARQAAAVVSALGAGGVAERLMSARGRAGFEALDAQDTSEARATNRRIEIVMQPDAARLAAASAEPAAPPTGSEAAAPAASAAQPSKAAEGSAPSPAPSPGAPPALH